MSVAVVTDSTADLPADLAAAKGITVVPLTVAINGVEGLEGHDVSPLDVARALGGRRASVTTSRPTPAAFGRAYQDLLDSGAEAVVSVHISAELSGTADSARSAARDVGERVTVVDSRAAGMGLGFAVLAAADAAAEGAKPAAVRDAALAAVARTDTLFYVDTLEFLRRGGRIGAAAALLGSALSVKPILEMADGAIVVRDKVRTASRALARLVDIAVEAAGEAEVDVAVHHLAAPDRATALADALAGGFGKRLRDRYLAEMGAAIAAHAGPGLVSVVVHRRHSS
jgi:DegV family protein with EDD domain